MLQFALAHNFTVKMTCFNVQWYTALLQQRVSAGSGTVKCYDGNVFIFEVVQHYNSVSMCSVTLLNYYNYVFQFAVVHYFTKYGSGECYFSLDFSSDSSSDDEDWSQEGGRRKVNSVRPQFYTTTPSCNTQKLNKACLS
jgi:hypothetical protein